MIAFIDEHREVYGVEPICKILPIAPSTYRQHVARRRNPETAPARARRDVVLRGKIRRVFDDNFQVYGVRDLLPENVRFKPNVTATPIPPTLKRRGRPPKHGGADHAQG